MRKSYLFTILILFFTSLANLKAAFAQEKKKLVDYVDNFIGVRDKNTSCILGPQLPQGSISPSPHTSPGKISYDMDCYVMGQPIRGFGQLHVSGTGWGKYGNLLISPQVGLLTGESQHDSPKQDETAKPYEYSVLLKRYNIKADVTPAVHSAIYRFTFPASDSSHILLDVTHNIIDVATSMRNKYARFVEGKVGFTDKNATELKGYGVYSGGFSDGDYRIYFCARLSKKPSQKGSWLNGKINEGQIEQVSGAPNDRVGAYVRYNTTDKEAVYLKIAVSLKSVAQATYWLDKEIPDWDFEKVKANATNEWEKELSKIKVYGGSDKEKRIFYTACYHTSIMPRDRTNDADGFGKDVPVWDDHLAVWDTWRTLYPLKVLTNPKMVSGTINSFIARKKRNGEVRDAFVAIKDKSEDQGGNDIDNIIADAFVKNVPGIDWKGAYALLKFDADQERKGIRTKEADTGRMYKKLGWIPAGRMSSSLTLEYAYNDFCTAQVAKKIGGPGDYKKYFERSQQWVNLWNPDAESDGFKGFVTTKKLGSGFIDIDVKKNWGSWREYFYEGSSWGYSYFVPHQFNKLVELSGGKKLFAQKLQYGLNNSLIDYGNEPAFLTVHTFHYAGRTDLSSFYVRKLMNDRFTEDGSIDNDDSGAMSSWYVFSALGFFPNAGQNIYYLTGSSFSSAKVTMGNGKVLNIVATNASNKNIYIQSCKINGKTWSKFWFTHQDIENGGTINFVMGDKPSQFNNQR